MAAAPRILVVDNHDSFTFNVVQGLREAGAAVGVVPADDPRLARALRLDGLVISPGPGRPSAAGRSIELLRTWSERVPVWGVCLGHQCLGVLHGARLVHAPQVLHGRTSPVRHHGRGLFTGLDDPVEVMRYHSLVVDPASVPASLEVTAWTDDGQVMGLRCPRTGAEGVQFHPESVVGRGARPLLAAFVRRCAGVADRTLAAEST